MFTLKTKIVGTPYIKGASAILKTVKVDEELELERDPENKYDSNCINILNSSGDLLGYIPKEENQELSKLMDSGEIFTVQYLGNKEIQIESYRRDKFDYLN